MSENKFYLTTPIYYVNARPHIGHAYTTIVADVLARRHRLLGDDTFFLTGTDEHGQKIERSAAAAGIPSQQFADGVSKSFEDLWKRMGITHDDYIRTTEDRHKRGVQKLFAQLYDRGFIYLASYTGQYCVSDEAFVDVTPGQPCPDCGRITETLTEENFFFKLSEFQLPLLNLIESDALAITPDSRKNEVLSFLRGNVNTTTDLSSRPDAAPPTTDLSSRPEAASPTTDLSSRPEAEGRSGEIPASLPATYARTAANTPYVPGALKDLSVSRSSFTWGIPVPEPAASAAAQKHVIYVWLDALANYITALGYGSEDESNFEKYWPADLHLVGKEIIRFHCVYWPAFLLAAGLPLPKAITAHGWLLFDDSKMSKSKGNIVRTETILDAFGDEVYGKQFPERTKPERDLFASDVLRYFLLREIPFGQDGSFSFDALITRYNADLANGYGNQVSRVMTMIHKHFDSIVPSRNEDSEVTQWSKNIIFGRALGPVKMVVGESGAQVVAPEMPDIFNISCENYAFEDFAYTLNSIFTAQKALDYLLTEIAPWKLTRDDSQRPLLSTTLSCATECLRWFTALLYPILPYATARVWTQLGLGDIELAARNGDLKNLQWGGLKPGTKLGPLSPIFPRADKGLANIMTDMENPIPHTTEDPQRLAENEQRTTTTDPAAAPRPISTVEPGAPLTVGGSSAHTSGPTNEPSHADTVPSAPFHTVASQLPITAGPADASPQIAIDDFAKVELRVAQIVVAERIPKADKLLRLEVDLGPDFPRRQILSGIAEWYTPEELIGRRIVVITNLAPRKMRGLESHGMLLAASNGEGGKPVLATFSEDIALGSRLK